MNAKKTLATEIIFEIWMTFFHNILNLKNESVWSWGEKFCMSVGGIKQKIMKCTIDSKMHFTPDIIKENFLPNLALCHVNPPTTY